MISSRSLNSINTYWETMNKNILIVDDEKQLCDSLGLIITQAGLAKRVFACDDPQKVRTYIKNIKVDIAFIDMRMTGLNGFKLLTELKQHHPKSRAFIISGYGDYATEREALRLGAEKFIPKPFDPNEIINLIKKAA